MSVVTQHKGWQLEGDSSIPKSVRAQALYMLATGSTPHEVSKRLGVKRHTVISWRQRFPHKENSSPRQSVVIVPEVPEVPMQPLLRVGNDPAPEKTPGLRVPSVAVMTNGVVSPLGNEVLATVKSCPICWAAEHGDQANVVAQRASGWSDIDYADFHDFHVARGF